MSWGHMFSRFGIAGQGQDLFKVSGLFVTKRTSIYWPTELTVVRIIGYSYTGFLSYKYKLIIYLVLFLPR